MVLPTLFILHIQLVCPIEIFLAKFRYYYFSISDNNTRINKVSKYVDSFYLYDSLKMIKKTIS
jgi:hypothetical protein